MTWHGFDHRCVYTGEAVTDRATPAPAAASVVAERTRRSQRKPKAPAGSQKPRAPLMCRDEDGSLVAMHSCDLCFITYEQLRKELGHDTREWVAIQLSPRFSSHLKRNLSTRQRPFGAHDTRSQSWRHWSNGSSVIELSGCSSLQHRVLKPCMCFQLQWTGLSAYKNCFQVQTARS